MNRVEGRENGEWGAGGEQEGSRRGQEGDQEGKQQGDRRRGGTVGGQAMEGESMQEIRRLVEGDKERS